MAVHKSRKSRSRRNMRRAHYKLENPAIAVDPETGEAHQRHRITPDGFYRGRRVIVPPASEETENEKG